MFVSLLPHKKLDIAFIWHTFRFFKNLNLNGVDLKYSYQIRIHIPYRNLFFLLRF